MSKKSDLNSRPIEERRSGDGEVVIVVLVVADDDPDVADQIDRFADQSWNVLEEFKQACLHLTINPNSL